jgi:hypothetical protein
MSDVIVPVTWVDQETLYSCGPAVAQMTLKALGVATPAIPPTWQQRLWTIIQTITNEVRPSNAGSGTPSAPAFPEQLCEKCPNTTSYTCWATSPKALERLLNGQQTSAVFAVTTSGNDAAATIALLDTLDRGVPGVALIRGWQHWVVVDGYLHGGPDPWALPGRNLNGVYVRNPQSAGLHYIDWNVWKDEYLNFVPCGQYANTILVISGRRNAIPPVPPPAPPTNVRILKQKAYINREELYAMMPPASARKEAQRVAATLLQGSARWRAALGGKEPDVPLLVQRLDRYDDYYYIVPFKRGQAETARLVVDATTGKFMEASAIEKEGESLAPYKPPTSPLESCYGRPLDLPAVRNRVVRPGTVGQHPVFVWKPCKESSSPLLPFYLLTVGDRVVYVRVDGQVFDELTDGPA